MIRCYGRKLANRSNFHRKNGFCNKRSRSLAGTNKGTYTYFKTVDLEGLDGHIKWSVERSAPVLNIHSTGLGNLSTKDFNVWMNEIIRLCLAYKVSEFYVIHGKQRRSRNCWLSFLKRHFKDACSKENPAVSRVRIEKIPNRTMEFFVACA